MAKSNFVEIEICDGESVTEDTRALTRAQVIDLFASKIHAVGVETWLDTFLTGWRVLDYNGLPLKPSKD